MPDEPAEKLSEVLTNLTDLADDEDERPVVARQIRVLREVQEQMQLQLRLHDAQIAALHEVIELLKRRAAS